jgi:uncharacterized protein
MAPHRQPPGYIGRKSNEIAHPLRVLEDSRLLIKEPDLFRSGRARYRIAEPLITFYQAIMSRERARLELGGGPAVWQGAHARFLSQVAGPHFGTICRDYAIASGSGVFGGPVGAGNPVAAVDLVFSPGSRQGRFEIWLRGRHVLRHLGRIE